jgi:uncharacterized protein YlxP (DUF503 family)
MVVGICTVELYIPEAHSLKDKRGVVKSITRRIRNKFNVSVCEVDKQDIWKNATIGLAAVCNDKEIIGQTFSAIDKFLDDYCDCQVVGFEVEIL